MKRSICDSSTGKLTAPMMEAVLERAREMADEAAAGREVGGS